MIKDIKDCIRIFGALTQNKEADDQALHDVVGLIVPFLSKRYGSISARRFEKLFEARRFEVALSLLNSLPNNRLRSFFIKHDITAMIIIGAVFIGLLFTLIYDREMNGTGHENNWQATKAIVVKSVPGSRLSDDGNSFEGYPDISYSYTVEGIDYSSDSILVSAFDGTASILDRFKEGQEIVIRYNPGNPQESYLDAQSNYNLILYIVAVILLLIQIPFLIRTIKRKRRHRT
jgi:hypothetical protein